MVIRRIATFFVRKNSEEREGSYSNYQGKEGKRMQQTQQTSFASAKDELQVQLNKLKRNRDMIPAEEQKTKYQAAFNKLDEDIMRLIYEMMKEINFYWYCKEENGVEARKLFLTLFKKAKPEMRTALYVNYDAGAVETMLRQIKEEIMAFLHERNDFSYSPVRCSIDPFAPTKFFFKEDGSIVMEKG